jgi:ABC-type arginine transport system ATPase subunit
MNAQKTNPQTGIKIKIRGVEAPPKLILYGPNGAGKSLVIRGLLARMVGRGYNGGDMAAMLVDVEGSASVVKVDEAGAVQHGVKIFNRDVVSFSDWGDAAVVNPEVVSKLFIDVYYDKYYDPDRGWRPLSALSYGERRRLAIEAALAASDVVLIENFEAGLHVDAVVGLIKQMAEYSGIFVLETHSGLVLKAAQRYGIPAYYVEPLAKLKPIERLDDSQLFARELSAWHAIV